MDHTNNKTMKDVVSQLRDGAAEALLELFELHVAVGELMLNAQVLSAVARELATESAQLADAPELASSERLRDLAKAAAKTSKVIDGQARAVTEIQRGLGRLEHHAPWAPGCVSRGGKQRLMQTLGKSKDSEFRVRTPRAWSAECTWAAWASGTAFTEACLQSAGVELGQPQHRR